MSQPHFRDSRPTYRGTLVFAAVAFVLVLSGVAYSFMAPSSEQNHPATAGINDNPSNLPGAPARR